VYALDGEPNAASMATAGRFPLCNRAQCAGPVRSALIRPIESTTAPSWRHGAGPTDKGEHHAERCDSIEIDPGLVRGRDTRRPSPALRLARRWRSGPGHAVGIVPGAAGDHPHAVAGCPAARDRRGPSWCRVQPLIATNRRLLRSRHKDGWKRLHTINARTLAICAFGLAVVPHGSTVKVSRNTVTSSWDTTLPRYRVSQASPRSKRRRSTSVQRCCGIWSGDQRAGSVDRRRPIRRTDPFQLLNNQLCRIFVDDNNDRTEMRGKSVTAPLCASVPATVHRKWMQSLDSWPCDGPPGPVTCAPLPVKVSGRRRQSVPCGRRTVPARTLPYATQWPEPLECSIQDSAPVFTSLLSEHVDRGWRRCAPRWVTSPEPDPRRATWSNGVARSDHRSPSRSWSPNNRSKKRTCRSAGTRRRRRASRGIDAPASQEVCR